MKIITENDHPKAYALRKIKPKWKARLLSVPHTGTRSVKKVLEQAGWKHQVDFVQQHFLGGEHWIIDDIDLPAIVPIRDSKATRESWARRHRKEQALREMTAHRDQFLEDNENVFLVHIDKPRKRKQDLKAIAEYFGLDLPEDFPQEGANGA